MSETQIVSDPARTMEAFDGEILLLKVELESAQTSDEANFNRWQVALQQLADLQEQVIQERTRADLAEFDRDFLKRKINDLITNV